MEKPEFLQALIDRIQSSASVKNVYGEPIEKDGKTIIPVARVAYGFGGGFGSGTGTQEQGQGEGMGGGGGVQATPVGVVEIDGGTTRFIPFDDKRKLMGAMFGGLMMGVMLSRMGKRRRHHRRHT